MKKSLFLFLLLSFITLTLTGCISFRSEIEGLYKPSGVYIKKKPVKLFFDFYHYKRDIGLDVIPKLRNYAEISDFDDIFKESLKQITNVAELETFTNFASDISNKSRMQKRDTSMMNADYTIKVEIHRNKSFAKFFLGGLFSGISVGFIPVRYTWNYTVYTDVINHDREVVGRYQRDASVWTWNENLLLPFYPFYPEEMANEEIYMEMMSDIFKQIDAEGVLKKE